MPTDSASSADGSGTVTAICVVHQLLPDPGQDPDVTAIDKRPVDGRVDVGPLGLVGDTQCDRRNHGGRDQAVYAYADVDAQRWADELGRGIPPGLFGENLRTGGVDVSGAVIGERWRIGGEGGVVVEVTGHRTPCMTFQTRMGVEHWIRRFTERRAPGAYLRVLTPGSIGSGDAVTVLHRPGHGVTVADTCGVPDPQLMGRLLAAADAGELDLAPAMRQHVARAAARA
jgi:MOSC domain-containing protein YiiM